MKLNKLRGQMLAIVIIAGITAPSCNRKKDNVSVVDESSTQYAEEQLILEQIYDNSDRVLERGMNQGAGALKGGEQPLSSCAIIFSDTTNDSNILRISIDFGSKKCLGYDGRYRSGRLVVDYSKNAKKLTQDGHYHKIVYENYTVDEYKVGGYREVWNKGYNNAGNMVFDAASIDTIYLPEGKGKITGVSQRTREMYSGFTTVQTIDDVYRITGFGNFINADKQTYYVEIVKPLVAAASCDWITEGVINIFPENALQRSIDFGKGDCENDATINVNGAVRAIKIP